MGGFERGRVVRIDLRAHRSAPFINGEVLGLAASQVVERVCMMTLTQDVSKVTGLKHCFRDRDLLRLCGLLPPPLSITRDADTVMHNVDNQKSFRCLSKLSRVYQDWSRPELLFQISVCGLTWSRLIMEEVHHVHSPFFDPGPSAKSDSLAVLHLKRDHLVPFTLRTLDQDTNGYAEGPVTNTRFGSFPHSTLLGLPWGSQVLASKVDTGSRGRKANKRKRENSDGAPDHGDQDGQVRAAITAGTGFAHLLPPTPEGWTISLPHRTQVVYTPDYSYILQRLRVAPGQTIIEAGAGSGSFTHAAARAIFSGYPASSTPADQAERKRQRIGQVCSYEYHEPRAAGLRTELQEHGLSDVVRVTHRDVYHDGFNLSESSGTKSISPKANAVFLDLPAPWMALRHLTRRALPTRAFKRATNPLNSETEPPNTASDTPTEVPAIATIEEFLSPLDPETPTQICTFSPCIEQVQSTVAAMRQLGWTEIEMVEVQQRRFDVRRERVGLQEEGLRGVQASAASVDEAVGRLREVEGRFKEWQDGGRSRRGQKDTQPVEGRVQKGPPSKQERLARIKEEAANRKLYKEGNLVHRTEPDVKSHTSFLVFAVLPREWTEEDEAKCVARWGGGQVPKEAEKIEQGKKGAKMQKKDKAQADGV